MNIKIIHLISFIVIILSFPVLSFAGELYIWVDKKGHQHITDQPPDESAKIIGAESYRKSSQGEIQRYEAERKMEQRFRDAEERAERNANQFREANTKAVESFNERQKEREAKRAIERKERASEQIEDLNARKERLRAIENRDYNEARRLRIRDEERKADRDIKKAARIKDQ